MDNQVNDLTRIVNTANVTNYKGKPPQAINIDDTGSYTVGLMDSARLELICMTNEPQNFHIELIDKVSLNFINLPGLNKWIKENCKRSNEAVTMNLGLDIPLSDGTDVVYAAVFKCKRFKPAVISLLERSPKYYVILGRSLEEVQNVYINRDFEELAAD